MTSLSVIIPSHNRQAMLSRALRSVARQTRPADQIIVIDDGSSDDTEARVRQDFPDVHYVRQDHLGVSAARNHGLHLAQGDWIAFLDSDDEWLPDKLEAQYQAAQNCPERLIHGDEIWIRNGQRVNPMQKHRKFGGWIYDKCLPRCVISPSCVMIHRAVFDTVGVFDEALPACEDYDLWLRICCRYPVHYLDRPLITKYGGHPDQLSRHFPAMDQFRIEALIKILNSDALSAANRLLSGQMLLQKATIYLQGARRRGRSEEADAWQARITEALGPNQALPPKYRC